LADRERRTLRLLRLHLGKFRSFKSATIDLDDLTVLVGPNDGGKSTIVEAIRFLLADDNSSWDRAAIVHRPRVAGDQSEDDFEYRYEPVTVIGEFGDLTAVETEALEVVTREGVVRVGAYFGDLPNVGRLDEQRHGPCWLLPDAFFPRLWPAASPTDVGIQPEVEPWVHGGEVWLPVRGGLTYPVNEAASRLSEAELPRVIWLGGPHEALADPRELLRPILARRIAALVDRVGEAVIEELEGLPHELSSELSELLSRAVPRYVPGATDAAVILGNRNERLVTTMVEAALRTVDLYIGKRRSGESWDTGQSELPPGSERFEALGSGARRGFALAVLELYLDSDVWPPASPLILTIEEPEAGLHAAAQQQVAKALSAFRLHAGIQTLVVTHSPTFVNEVPPETLRIVRQASHEMGRVTRPEDLGEIGAELGLRPGDLLMAEHFIVVEGRADVEVFGEWARRLGAHPDELGARFVAAKGWTKAETAATILRLAYPGSRVSVILDGGPKTVHGENEIRSAFGDTIPVSRLSRPEIEAYFSREAIAAWLLLNGGNPEQATRFDPSVGTMSAKGQLIEISQAAFGGRRRYAEVNDAVAIARLMPEEQIPAEIRDLLLARLVRSA
jgi:energy-coupling factor transporter ATP-binding protein EcfA2